MYRWASPIQEAVKNWDKETWLTIMYMSKWMDVWDILAIEKVIIDKLDKTEDIFNKFEIIGPSLLTTTLKWVIDGSIKWIKQDDKKATYCGKIVKEDWKIDFKNDTWEEIFNKFRAYYIWPWIYTYYNDKKFDIEDCEIIDYNWNEKIWKVVKIEKKIIWVVCNDKKILILKQIKLEWKKSMDILSFVNWNKDFLEYEF
jgi:methionyl-tRNA formyltransferase